MTVDDLKKDNLFQSLTPKQKVFLEAYCSNGSDMEKAAQLAYPNCKNINTLRATAYDALKSKKIAYLTGRFFGYHPDKLPFTREEFMGLLAGRIRDSRLSGTLFLQLSTLYLRMTPWAGADIEESGPLPEPEADVDSIVKQMEARGK